MRRRLAIIGVGMIDAGALGRGVPALQSWLCRLSEQDEIIVYRLSRGYLPHPHFQVRSLPKIPLHRYLEYAWMMILFLRDHLSRPFDLIYAISPTPAGRMAVYLKKLLGVPVVIQFDAEEGIALNASGQELKHYHRIQQVISTSDAITALTHYQCEILERNFSGAKWEVITRGIAVEEFMYREREVHAIPKLLYVGYDQVVKDPELMMAVFVKLRESFDCCLHIVGEGLTLEFFQALPDFRRYAHQMVIHGAVKHEAIKSLLQEVDILVVTSRYESQSVIAMEAMASGVAVVGTAVGVLADSSGEACLTALPSAEALALEIGRLVRDPKLYLQMCRQGRRWVEEHSIAESVCQYRALHEQMIQRDGSKH